MAGLAPKLVVWTTTPINSDRTARKPWGRCPGMRQTGKFCMERAKKCSREYNQRRAALLRIRKIEFMSTLQLDKIKNQLLTEENSVERESVFIAFMEDPQRGANMVFDFAKDHNLELNSTSSEVVDYLNMMDIDDIELTPQMLAMVAGGRAMGGPRSHRKN